MAKNFPYFKFIATEWLTGDIVFEDFSTQGVFINICALYWQRNGDLSIEDLNRRFKNNNEIPKLTDRFFSVNDGKISISFLDEQLIDANHISKVNSENGSKGGRPKANKTEEKKPTANRPLTDRKPKKSKEEKEEELNKRKKEFALSLEPFLTNYGKEFLNDFYSYWTEPNQSKTKFRKELETAWDLERRLSTWAKREKTFRAKKPEPKKSLGI